MKAYYYSHTSNWKLKRHCLQAISLFVVIVNLNIHIYSTVDLNELTAEDDIGESEFKQCKINNNRAEAYSEEHKDDKSFLQKDRKLFLSEGGWYVIISISNNAVSSVSVSLSTITCKYGKTQILFLLLKGHFC